MEKSEIWQAVLNYSREKKPHVSDKEHIDYANSYITMLVTMYQYGAQFDVWRKYYNEYLKNNPDSHEFAYSYANRCIVDFVKKLTINDLTVYHLIEFKLFDEEIPEFLEIRLRELSEEYYQKGKTKKSIAPDIEKIMNTRVERLEPGRLGLPSDKQYYSKGQDRLRRKRRK